MAINKSVKATSANSPAIVKAKQGGNTPAIKDAGKGTSLEDSFRATGRDEVYPNSRSAQQVNRRTLAMSVSIGNIGPEDKPEAPSIKIRGTGAAERGTKASAKMG